jgi:tetratricopeptide (TPR) repeat protein
MVEAQRQYRRAAALDPKSPSHPRVVSVVFLSLGDVEQAQAWMDRSSLLHGEQTQASMDRSLLLNVEHPRAMFQRAFFSVLVGGENPDRLIPALEQARYQDVRNSGGGNWSLKYRQAMLRIQDLSAVRNFYVRIWPELLTAEDPVVGRHNLDAAVDIAWLLLQEGNDDLAQALLAQTLSLLRSTESIAEKWYIVEVQALVLLGRNDEALSAMRQAVDRGWRINWWYAETDPILAPISDHPDFIGMLDEIRTDMAVQLEQVREMERRGELEPMPELVGAP